MSVHVLLNFLNKLGKRDKMRGLPSIYLFFATNLMNPIIQDLIGFVALRPKSTAMVIAGRSVHLTTLFPGQA